MHESLPPDNTPFARFWERLLPSARDAAAREYSEACARQGLYVWRAPEGREVPIPASLSPLVYSDPRRARLSRNARVLASAVSSLSVRMFREGRFGTEGSRLTGGYSPVETASIARGLEASTSLATVRVDSFEASSGEIFGLELNSTIPAMQGYQDIISSCFIRAMGRAAGLAEEELERLIASNGSNIRDLHDSLCAHFWRLGGAGIPARIAIVAREGDSQIGELRAIRDGFGRLGSETRIVTPDAITGDDAGGTRLVDGTPVDLVYRHIFASRVEPGSAFGSMLPDSSRWRILNPVNAWNEAKALFGYLQEYAADPDACAQLGITDEAREVVLDGVPWTRVLRHGPGTTPDGERVADLAAWTAANGARVIVKKSNAYGGRSVFLLESLDSQDVQSRLRDLFGSPGDGVAWKWERFVDRATGDPNDLWIVQGLVQPLARRMLMPSASGEPIWGDWYADVSAYGSTGVDVTPSGCACRIAPGRIVNIATGGGMVPLLRESVAMKLFGE